MSKNQKLIPKEAKVDYSKMDMLSIELAKEKEKDGYNQATNIVDAPVIPAGPTPRPGSKEPKEKSTDLLEKEDVTDKNLFLHLKLTKENMDYVRNVKVLENLSASEVINMIIDTDRTARGENLQEALSHLQKSVASWRRTV